MAIVLSPIFGHYSTIIEGLNKLISYIAPPITAVFLFGVFWRKATGRAAYSTLVTGAVLGFVMFLLDWNGIYQGNFMMTAFYLLVFCSLLIIAVSLLWPEALKEEAKTLVWENWREPLRSKLDGALMSNYKLLAGLVVATFIVLYYVFR
ncbi:MAG: hypothetical protein WB699_07480 [Bacteroidota bacterium]